MGTNGNLMKSALQSARQTRYKPGTRDGKPVKTIMKLTMSFSPN